MIRTVIASVFIALICGYDYTTSAQEAKIFEIVKKGEINALRTYLDTTKTPINIVNIKGYSPLHVLIDHYVEYRSELRTKDPYSYEQSLQKYEQYRACLLLLLEKGASTQQKSPEGWNALQYATVKGKADAVSELLDKTKDGGIRDDEGNTLMHLSLLANPETTKEIFWTNLMYRLFDYNISVQTPNAAGQTPLAFYMSLPRCNTAAASTPSTGKLLGASSSSSTPACPTASTFDMLKITMQFEAIMTPGFNGKTALDYAKMFNPWAVSLMESHIESYRRVQAEWEPHLKKFAQQVEENKRIIQEYEARKAREAQQAPSRSTGCKNYCSSCQGTGSGGEIGREVECPVCYGRGISDYSKSEISGYEKKYTYYSSQTCYKCNGSGRRTVYELHLCGACRGSGCSD